MLQRTGRNWPIATEGHVPRNIGDQGEGSECFAS
jgi:hypothetical protein